MQNVRCYIYFEACVADATVYKKCFIPGKIHLSQHILRAVLLVNKYVLKLEMIHSNQAE